MPITHAADVIRTGLSLLAWASFGLLAGAATAADNASTPKLAPLVAREAAQASAETARSMVKEAAAYLRSQGRDAALRMFNDPKGIFTRGELYVFAFDLNGRLLANPHTPENIGRDLRVLPDARGKLFRQEFLDIALSRGSGWVEYTYRNPVDGNLHGKVSYVEKVDDLILGCGVYK